MFMVAPWMQQGQQQSPQDITDTYARTGFHYLVDHKQSSEFAIPPNPSLHDLGDLCIYPILIASINIHVFPVSDIEPIPDRLLEFSAVPTSDSPNSR